MPVLANDEGVLYDSLARLDGRIGRGPDVVARAGSLASVERINAQRRTSLSATRTMHINVDEIMRPDWSDDLGDRAFAYDVFLSHNRHDASADLARELTRFGAGVWHDGDADLRDRRVSQKVARALRASRFVAVCIGSGFRDSEWCKAEYAPALIAEKSADATRVLVVCLAPESIIPKTLQHCPRFSVNDPIRIGSYVCAGNKLPFLREEVVSTEPILAQSELQRLFEHMETPSWSTSANESADPNGEGHKALELPR
jgi:hypothetical protein